MQLGEEYMEQIYLPIEECDRRFTLCQQEDIQMKLFEDIVSVDAEEVPLHLHFENTEHQCSTVYWNKHKENSRQAFCKGLTYLLIYYLLTYEGSSKSFRTFIFSRETVRAGGLVIGCIWECHVTGQSGKPTDLAV